MTQPNGYTFQLNFMDGRFYPVASGSVGFSTCVVTGAPDIHAAAAALNSVAEAPTEAGRWTVAWDDLALAVQQGTTAALTAWTL